MAKAFFSYREQIIPRVGKVPLDYHFRNAFGDLWDQAGNSFELSIANGNPSGDGRLMGVVECVDQATLDAVLRSFPNDLESIDDAAAKMNLWGDRKGDRRVTVDGNMIRDPAKGDT